MNVRVIDISNQRQARRELEKINCDEFGINIMAPKAIFKTLKIEKVPSKAANLLKQTFLAKGGEAAVARGTADLSVESTDVVICATMKQYNLALAQLKLQPWGLPKVANAISNALKAADNFPYREFKWPGKRLLIRPHKTLVMGILNLTPDSFSDGGKYNSCDIALKKAEELVQAGADIIDIGAESTRPGFTEISESEEMERLLPVLEKLTQTCDAPISIDTYKAGVAKAALECGANIINDIWGLQKDPNMARVVANYNVPVIIMHNRLDNEYQTDIMADICKFLAHSIDIGVEAGISFENFITDPGIGFAKHGKQNLTVMSRLEELKSLGCPILLGTSRKRFIGEVLDLPVNDRVEGTAATVAVGITKGANIVRVHDVGPIARVIKMTDAMARGDIYD